jgi:protein SCO1/2
MSQPSWAATSPVTIGGPFTLVAPDGTTVTDQTFRGKWLLVYFGYTFCPNTCPMTLNEIATALEKLGADAAKLKPLFITVRRNPARACLIGLAESYRWWGRAFRAF